MSLRALFVAALALVGLGARAQEKVELIVWGVANSPNDKGLDAALRVFNARYPHIKLRLLSMGAGAMNPQKLMTAIVGGVPPDVIRQDRFTISDWASRGAFVPLDDLIARDRKVDPMTPIPEDYYPSVWEEASYNGSLYGIPTHADNRALYWNRAIFREKASELRAAGLDPTRAPRTWSEVLAYSKVFTEFGPDGSLKRAGFMPNYGNSWLYMYGFQNNAEFLSPDGMTCTLNTTAAVEALEFMLAGYEIIGGFANSAKFEASFQGEENDPFLSGKIAMVVNGDWVIPNYLRYKPTMDFSVVPAPVPDDRYYKRGRFKDERDQFITWSGGFSYAIPRGARQLEAAWTFVKFMTSAEVRLIEQKAQDAFERSRGRRFMPPIAANIRTNELAIKEFVFGNSAFDAAYRTHVDLMAVSRIRPATAAAQILWDEHVRAMEQAMRKVEAPAVALGKGQARVQRFLDEIQQEQQYPVIDLRIPWAIGGGLFVAALIACAVWFKRQRLGRLAAHEAKWGYLLISPWLIGFLIFTLGPMLASIFFSFTQYNVLNEARWVGGKNYVDLLTVDVATVGTAFGNVAYLAGIGLPLGIIIGLAVALLLNASVKGMRLYRTVFYMPAVVPGVASIVLWIWLLNADPARGLINGIWAGTVSEWFGTRPPGWTVEVPWTKPSVILMSLWGAGSGMILWLAALKGIPKQLYEAAAIDGARPSQQFFSVTLPQLSPIIFFNVVMGLVGWLQAFDAMYIMTGGYGFGPNDSLLTPVYHLFTNAFNYFRMGAASALAWLIFVLIVAVTIVQFKLAPKWVHYEVER